MIAEKNGFVPASSSPFCGTDIPGHHDRVVLSRSTRSIRPGAHSVRRAGGSPLLDGDGVLRAGPHRHQHLFAQLLGRVLVEHVEQVVVAHLEDLGGGCPCRARCSRTGRNRRRHASALLVPSLSLPCPLTLALWVSLVSTRQVHTDARSATGAMRRPRAPRGGPSTKATVSSWPVDHAQRFLSMTRIWATLVRARRRPWAGSARRPPRSVRAPTRMPASSSARYRSAEAAISARMGLRWLASATNSMVSAVPAGRG